MTDLERAIQAIEQGLLKAKSIKDRPVRKMELGKRMAYYKVPGFSVALIDQGELAWAKGYGVLEAGGDNGSVKTVRPAELSRFFVRSRCATPPFSTIGPSGRSLSDGGLPDFRFSKNTDLVVQKLSA